MRISLSQSQWQAIIETQQSRGLTIIDYCREHQLSTSSFYAVHKKIGSQANNFVQAKIRQETEWVASALIELSFHQAKVILH
jgi:hypothetical protein